MSAPLASSMEGRIRSCRRDLVLQLATQHGPFWVAIRGLRSRWSIDPETQRPPRLAARRLRLGEADCYYPRRWPTALDRPFAPEADASRRPGPRFEDVMPRPEWSDADEGRHPLEPDWWADLEALHDAVVLPPNLVVVGTVNVDETTHGFADKFYDRAQLIELGARREDLVAHLRDAAYRHDLMAP